MSENMEINNLQTKLDISRRIKERYPDAEIGFFHQREHYIYNDGDD